MPLTTFKRRRSVQDILGKTTFFLKELEYEWLAGVKVRSTESNAGKAKESGVLLVMLLTDKASCRSFERHSISL